MNCKLNERKLIMSFNIYRICTWVFKVLWLIVMISLVRKYKNSEDVSEKNHATKATIIARAIAFGIDYAIACIGTLLAGVLISNFPQIANTFFYDRLIFAALLIFRDCLGKRSLGKRFMGLYIGHIKNVSVVLEPISFKQRIARNLTTYFWKTELIILLVSKDTRSLGDKLTYTDVYKMQD